MVRYAALIVAILCSSFMGAAQTPEDTVYSLKEVVVRAEAMLGSLHAVQHRTGASTYLDRRELRTFNTADIHRALQTVAGVTYYEEDGFGLRPNISIRGTSPQRSAKITVMEDGVLISPAPYSAPAAYYFPTVSRMEGLEVVKGSSQIQYGPFTTGGAINLISTSIPDSFSARASMQYGLFNSRQNHATVGKSSGQIGFLLEFANRASDGFKQLPNKGPAGFNTSDLMTKIRLSSKPYAWIDQYIELKYHRYEEKSNETYLGVTSEDFERDPYTRYAASQNDQMRAGQTQWMITHQARPARGHSITTQVYWNRVQRNWYKLDDVTFDGETLSIAEVMRDPYAFINHLTRLQGQTNTGPDALWLKANNRLYNAYGAQTRWNQHWYGSRGTRHQLEMGGRWHADNEDRLQWEDGYEMIEGELVETSAGLRGAAGNRISATSASAVYGLYKVTVGNWTFAPGIRHERINLKRTDFGESDPDRIGSALSVRGHQVSIWIPGVGFLYNWTPERSLFGGVHRGFSPPGNNPGQDPELSVNYELGARLQNASIRAEASLFFNDYSNLLGSDLAATGGTGSLDLFNAGSAHVGGVEALVRLKPISGKNYQAPLSFSYTLTDARFRSNFESSEDLWGTVRVGDRIPYIPIHQFNISAQFISPSLEFALNGRYQGAMNAVASGDSERLEPYFLIDAAIQWQLKPQVQVSMQLVNVLNNTYVASRVPAGLRPGHPFGLYAGVSIAL